MADFSASSTRDPKVADSEPPDSGFRPGRLRQGLFALAALVLFFAFAELVLRAIGFRFVPVPILPQSAWGPEQLRAMNEELEPDIIKPDDLLFWKLKPGGRLGARRVNPMGLLNRPVVIPKPAHTYRIVCLGDSCTVLGPLAYSTVLEKRLAALRRADGRFETINAGVFGYTSLQGLRLFRDRLAGARPDLVTVYFGWNDHYLTKSYPDKLLRSRELPPPAVLRLLRALRVYQLVWRGVHSFQMRRLDRLRAGKRLARVAPDDYRANLTAIADLARQRAARVLFLTAPSNHGPGNVPEAFVELGLAESADALVVRHRQYNDIVREVAAECAAELLDLEAEFDARDDKDDLFMLDGVHLTLRGRRLIGDMLVQKIGRMDVLSPEERARIDEALVYDSAASNRLSGRVELLGQPLRATAGTSLTLAVRATNTGDTIWLAKSDQGLGHIQIGAVAYDPEGRRRDQYMWGQLAHDVRPGETIEVRWTAGTFSEPGRYVIEVGPVLEDVAWFHELGDPRTTATLTVAPRSADGNP